MYSRQDYLSGECTHSQYYSQFVTPYLKRKTLQLFGFRIDPESDPHLNKIPLECWDDLSTLVGGKKFKELGDFRTLAGCVCVLKESARQAFAEQECVV